MGLSKAVSVIIPCYNWEKYLKRCIGSLINQTYKNIEIICVNDWSTDNSLELLNSLSEQDKRIKSQTLQWQTTAGILQGLCLRMERLWLQ